MRCPPGAIQHDGMTAGYRAARCAADRRACAPGTVVHTTYTTTVTVTVAVAFTVIPLLARYTLPCNRHQFHSASHISGKHSNFQPTYQPSQSCAMCARITANVVCRDNGNRCRPKMRAYVKRIRAYIQEIMAYVQQTRAYGQEIRACVQQRTTA
jgi:hypothetical protein